MGNGGKNSNPCGIRLAQMRNSLEGLPKGTQEHRLTVLQLSQFYVSAWFSATDHLFLSFFHYAAPLITSHGVSQQQEAESVLFWSQVQQSLQKPVTSLMWSGSLHPPSPASSSGQVMGFLNKITPFNGPHGMNDYLL